MFGDDEQNQNDQQQSAGAADGGFQPASAPVEPSANPAPAYEPAASAPQDNNPVLTTDSLPGTQPALPDPTASAPSEDNAASTSLADDSSDSAAASEPSAPSQPAAASDDLLDIKKQALAQLSPLVDKLDQSPEEKFRTTMMMIQASDNKDLIKDAYSAAQAIGDEKERAQALLDIINEINYFTQRQG